MTTTPCVNCGEPLAEGTRFCSNCGTRQPEPSAQDAPTIMSPQIPPPPAGSGQGQNAVPPTILASPPQTPPQGYSAPQQNYGAPPGYATPQEPPAKKSRFPLIAIILGVVGLCLIVGVVGGIGALTVLGRSVSESETATAGAAVAVEPTARPTRARATATPEAEATTAVEPTTEATPEAEPTTAVDTAATEAAALEATALADQNAQVAEATAAIATAQALQNEQTQALQATAAAAVALGQGAQVIFRDEFVDNRNNWFIGRFEDKESNVIEDGVFKVIRDAKGRSFELYQPRGVTNFVTDVDCKVLAGNDGGCGIVYGESENVGHWEFEVFNDYYRLSIVEGDNTTMTLEGDPTGIVRPNDFNKIRVIRRDGVAYLFLNDTLLNTSADNRFDKGRVGVLTSSYQDNGQVEIHFDNFTVAEIR